MSNLEIVTDYLLTQNGLTLDDVAGVLDTVFVKEVDFADLYFQALSHESISLEDKIVKSSTFSKDNGVGIRALSGTRTGFSFCDDLKLETIKSCAVAARDIVDTKHDLTIPKLSRVVPQLELYTGLHPSHDIDFDAKIAVLKQIDERVRKFDKVAKVNVSLSSSYSKVLIIASDGTLATDIRPLVRLDIGVIAQDDGRTESAHIGLGGRYDFSRLLVPEKIDYAIAEVVRQIKVALVSKPAPAGTMPVVLSNGWPGILLHEAVGHGLEGDFNRKKTSKFADRLGKQVASELCTVVDDGTIPSRRGSLHIDDEGVETKCTTLIENGKLVNYMQDKHNARLMGMELTGNGRRESYAHTVMPRMTNTYMLNGKSSKDEIISSVKEGLYAVNFGGGQVDITSGKFVFNTSEAYLIKNGKITHPVKGATLIGDGPAVMQKISMVGNDLELDIGVGTCGKNGQNVPVGVGQPTLLVDEITVGGGEV